MKREELIRHQFDGLTAEIYDQKYLTPTVFFKERLKDDIAEKEMIMAYLKAAELLCCGLLRDNNPLDHMRVVRSNQICMPFLYVCRHSIELSIKFRNLFQIKKIVSVNKLSELYEKLIVIYLSCKIAQNFQSQQRFLIKLMITIVILDIVKMKKIMYIKKSLLLLKQIESQN